MGIRKAYPMALKNEEATNVMAFDALYTTNQIQKIKVLLPYIEPSMQKHLAVYIKYMELQYTMKHVRRHPFQISGCSISSEETPDLRSLCRQLSLYSSPEEIRQLEQLQNMFETLETMQEMTQTMSALQEIFPDLSAAPPFGSDSAFSDSEGAESAQTGPFSVMDMMMNMLTPEQRAMYEMFQQSYNNSDSD
ncbi:MAG: hypothetical protein J1F18_13180 [Lachnospiraceae bacterium]|nr:hypothetical protein [Lachnospiraceae bacterium]